MTPCSSRPGAARLNPKIRVYFCDPHSPWQRGGHENSNGLLRQCFLENADFSIYTRAELNAVARQLIIDLDKRWAG